MLCGLGVRTLADRIGFRFCNCQFAFPAEKKIQFAIVIVGSADTRRILLKARPVDRRVEK